MASPELYSSILERRGNTLLSQLAVAGLDVHTGIGHEVANLLGLAVSYLYVLEDLTPSAN